ncbi:MAG: helix-turn-helix domain-containing protein [Actinomycetota bacterium]|nr:helix-turn-helix domain-containing protein [Actinomycetota bacterium]
MKRAPSYSPEVKARAIGALLLGARPRTVAREHGIPESTVTTWRHRLKTGKLRHEKKGGHRSDFGELLMECLEASLRSSIAQARQMQDPEWIRRQPAGELAVLFGIAFDGTLRTIELLPAFLRSLRDGEG